jgi:hypothetical protein
VDRASGGTEGALVVGVIPVPEGMYRLRFAAVDVTGEQPRPTTK